MNLSQRYKPKLVFCTSRFPFPLEKGDKLRAFYQIKSLSEHFRIHLICTTENEVSKEDLAQIQPFCEEIHSFKLKKGLILFNLFFALLNSKPFQVAYFTQTWIQKKINQLLLDIKPDHIFCQLIRPAEYVKNYHTCSKTIDIMDALSMGIERREKKANFFIRFIFREEAKRLKKYERQILNYFEKSTIISQQDKNYLIYPKGKEIQVLANGVDEKFYNCELKIEKEFDLVFTGNMNYPPNVEAAKIIKKDILPELLKLNPKTRILISGSNPSPSLKKLEDENFLVSGWVDDIRESYLKAKIFIAPMMSGTGMQNKILEAMALGIPCITTSLANNAILAENNKEILIADDVKLMLDKIKMLQENAEFYVILSQNGKQFIQKKYTWDSINLELVEMIKKEIA
ncbi:MAG: glycosyltransferase [Bacteroidota bacterium]